MAKRHDAHVRPPRLSPNRTVGNVADEFIDDLRLPNLPQSLPQRLADAVDARVVALLYQLREARHEKYVLPLEVRLVREAYGAVLTAFELGLQHAEEHYAEFRQLVEDLGFEAVEVGFRKRPDPEESNEV